MKNATYIINQRYFIFVQKQQTTTKKALIKMRLQI